MIIYMESFYIKAYVSVYVCVGIGGVLVRRRLPLYGVSCPGIKPVVDPLPFWRTRPRQGKRMLRWTASPCSGGEREEGPASVQRDTAFTFDALLKPGSPGASAQRRRKK